MFKRNILTLIISISCIIMLTACNSQSKSSSGPVNGKKYEIVTSFYPVYITALNVARDISDVDVVNMTQPQTGCLHDYQLTPSNMKTLEQANVFIINGAGMEAFMDKITRQMPGLQIIEASKGIELIKNMAGGDENPHVWVSISNAILQVRNIAQQLAAIDTKHAGLYEKNAAIYIEKLEAEKDKMHKALDGIKNRDIVTFHEAFPYFAKEFNLNIVTIIEREPGSEPSAGQLADIITVINKTGVKALFAEPQYSPKAIESIAKQTDAKVYTLDPVTTGENRADYDAYLNAMDVNLKSLIEALK